ncbi:MAG: hypothetical protein KC912_16800 [Proteobacteria bacterium]|nr:hypothetical protein [Pseudomonadota bacterium]
MSRLFPILAILTLSACTDDFGDTASSPTDPTAEFAIEIPGDEIDNDGDGIIDEGIIDTGWPSYSGSRRRSAESGWRTIPSDPVDLGSDPVEYDQ